MCEVKWPEHAIPLRLRGGAFAINQQLTEAEKKNRTHKISSLHSVHDRWALSHMNSSLICTFDQEKPLMCTRQNYANWPLFLGGISNCSLACAFVKRLPNRMKWHLRAPSRMEVLTIKQMLARARAIMKDENPDKNLAVSSNARDPPKDYETSS